MKSKNIVWDIQTRVFHWMIALPVLLNFFLDGEENPHKWLGYVALIGLSLRLMWEFRPGTQKRFSAFMLNWNDVKNYILQLIHNEAKPTLAHNPMASWVYIFIWIIVVLLGSTGFMMGLDAFWGEDWLEELHGTLATIMKVLVFLHLSGIIFDSFKFKRQTWLGMITGKK